MHERGVIGVGGKVSRLREGGLRQEVSYRGAHSAGEWGVTHGYSLPVDEDVGDASVARQRGVGLVGGDGGWAGGVRGHCTSG